MKRITYGRDSREWSVTVTRRYRYLVKKENIKDKKGQRILKAPELGKLLGLYEYKDGLIKSMELRAWGAEFNFYNTF